MLWQIACTLQILESLNADWDERQDVSAHYPEPLAGLTGAAELSQTLLAVNLTM